MKNLVFVLALLAAPVAAANLGTVDFTGTVLTRNGVEVAPVAGSVVGSVTFSDGGDPDGPPTVPAGYTGVVSFDDISTDPGTSNFSWSVVGVFNAYFDDMNPYHSAQVDLVHGRIVGLNLFTDGDSEILTLAAGPTGGTFNHREFDDDSDDGGEWRLDVASGTPEPATWALLVSGFGMTGVAVRSARRSLAAAA